MQIARVEKTYSEQELKKLKFEIIPKRIHQFLFYVCVTVFFIILISTIVIFFVNNLKWYGYIPLIILIVTFGYLMSHFGELYGNRKDVIDLLLKASKEAKKDIVFYNGKFRFFKFSEFEDNKWCMKLKLKAAKIYINDDRCPFLANLFKKQEEKECKILEEIESK